MISAVKLWHSSLVNWSAIPLLRRFLIVLIIVGSASCAPRSLNPTAQDVVGEWQVHCEGGTETLVLKADGHYAYTIMSPQRQMKANGAWTIEPATKVDDADIILPGAPWPCDNPNDWWTRQDVAFFSSELSR